ncbi:uncharacterized protein E0L32_000359 [Thyridium curvatum]|uniref:ENTH domain-containing protein n=1 Tax=Thyridium curvatum TaxID=1093900 RepID=A0A507AYX3_9PEZI|nr:uncharacterized protein E0L32_000359 [Thyridium curvatum]TPX16025.1 hypothetical protein E0L32_000359 [Thyridium curvatum]
MDFNSLKDQVSNLTLYDLKAGVRKVQNAVMNYTEMEAKVREATNNEPWGASSTLMQEIANGTFNYQTLNEIMPMIYRRFTEKSAEEWRQIYKSLQLLEFLIKHGSERVIDDARSHLTLLKMLRQFHFIDQNGKDQGINVRNRAKELAELLGDVDRIRAERKKARSNKAKYTGVEGGMSFGGGFSSGGGSSRYGGFGSESAGSGRAEYGGYSGGVYGDGGGFGGQSDYQESSSSRRDKFEEYDEFDEGERPARTPESSRAGTRRTTGGTPAKKPEPKKKEPEVDLFSFDEPAQTSAAPVAAAPAPASSSGLAALSAPADDDDFDDFQSPTPEPAAPTGGFAKPLSPPVATSNASGAQFAAPQPLSAPKQANLSDMVGMSSISPTSSTAATPGANYSSLSSPLATGGSTLSAQAAKPTGYQASGPNYFQSVQAGQSQPSAAASTPGMGMGMGATKPAAAAAPGSGAAKPAAGGDAFGALWSKASGTKKATSSGAGPAMGQLAKEKSAAGIWGAPSSSTSSTPMQSSKPQQSTGGGSLDDLLG